MGKSGGMKRKRQRREERKKGVIPAVQQDPGQNDEHVEIETDAASKNLETTSSTKFEFEGESNRNSDEGFTVDTSTKKWKEQHRGQIKYDYEYKPDTGNAEEDDKARKAAAMIAEHYKPKKVKVKSCKKVQHSSCNQSLNAYPVGR
jgi:hypothetical protein